MVSTYTFPGPNLTPAETWASGVRTPYGLAFSPTGELWEVEHGPRGGDELNLIEKGKNYGWPLVSYGKNYNGVPIPKPDTRPDLAKPVLYWVPVIAPGNLMFYHGTQTFPQWNGNGFISGLATMTLNRIIFDGHGGAKTAERWDRGPPHPRCGRRPRWLAVDAGRRQSRRPVPCDTQVITSRQVHCLQRLPNGRGSDRFGYRAASVRESAVPTIPLQPLRSTRDGTSGPFRYFAHFGAFITATYAARLQKHLPSRANLESDEPTCRQERSFVANLLSYIASPFSPSMHNRAQRQNPKGSGLCL